MMDKYTHFIQRLYIQANELVYSCKRTKYLGKGINLTNDTRKFPTVVPRFDVMSSATDTLCFAFGSPIPLLTVSLQSLPGLPDPAARYQREL